MAGYFSETVAAYLDGATICMAVFGRFEFPDGEMRLWLGNGKLEIEGETWHGIGQWGGISEIVSGAGDAAIPVVFTLSGVDEEIVSKVQDVRGGVVTIYVQAFRGDTGQPLDGLRAFYVGTMDQVSFEVDAGKAVISLTTEGPWVNRSKTAAGLLTHRDQQSPTRHPGDLGLEFVPAVVNKLVKWFSA